MIRLLVFAVLIGCGTSDIGDPIACPACEPGELFEHHFLDVSSLLIAGTPRQVVRSLPEQRRGITERDKIAWLSPDYTVQQQASTGIEPKPDRARNLRALAMADDGAVAALVEVDDGLEGSFRALMVFDADGRQRWRHESEVSFTTLSIGPRHVFVTNGDRRPATVGGQTVNGPFLAALDREDGSLVWSKTINISPASGARIHTAPDPSGGVLVGAAFAGEVDLGGGVSLTGSASQTGFVALLDDHGVGRWAVPLEPIDDTPGNSFVAAARIEHLARGPRGEVALVASWFGGPLTFLGQTYATPPQLDGNLIALLAPDGKLAWARDVGKDRTTSILTDGQELIVAGLFFAPLSYDGTAPQDEHDGFVAAVTPDGPRWLRHARGPGRQAIDVVSYAKGSNITAVISHEYNGGDGPKPATYGDVTILDNGIVLGALAP
jgi:outer membrane protein assembly factor BamB